GRPALPDAARVPLSPRDPVLPDRPGGSGHRRVTARGGAEPAVLRLVQRALHRALADGPARRGGRRAPHVGARAPRGRAGSGLLEGLRRVAPRARRRPAGTRGSGARMTGLVLVTGAAGFIGSTLVEKLLASGADVIGVDAFTDNYPASTKRENVSRLSANRRFRLVEADLRTANIDPLLDGVDGVIHLAALPGVRASWGDPFRAYAEHNVVATQRLLEAVRRHPVRRLVAASSSSVYGLPTRFPTPED